jgi:hypothetical protein
VSHEFNPPTQPVKTTIFDFISSMRSYIEEYELPSPTSCWPPTVFFACQGEHEAQAAVAEEAVLLEQGWPAVRDVIYPEIVRKTGARMAGLMLDVALNEPLLDEEGIITTEAVIFFALDPWHRRAYRSAVIRDPTMEDLPRLGSWRRMQADDGAFSILLPYHQAIVPRG